MYLSLTLPPTDPPDHVSHLKQVPFVHAVDVIDIGQEHSEVVVLGVSDDLPDVLLQVVEFLVLGLGFIVRVGVDLAITADNDDFLFGFSRGLLFFVLFFLSRIARFSFNQVRVHCNYLLLIAFVF